MCWKLLSHMARGKAELLGSSFPGARKRASSSPCGFERAKDQTGMVTPVAQTWEKHPEREKHCKETSTEDFLYFEAEAGHAAKQRGRSSIAASLKVAFGGADSAEGMNFPG